VAGKNQHPEDIYPRITQIENR